MNENMINNNQDNVSPYKATGNLNTLISNPNVNINNTMDVNIQNASVGEVSRPNTNNTASVVSQDSSPSINTQSVPNGNSGSNISNENQPSMTQNMVPNQNMASSVNQNRTYVTTDNKPKKKKIAISIGPEFKIALLIIVILLVFIFLLPIISDIF